jgi:DNA-directed RNA polymerase subunit H (RpoH/RPB5)
LVECLPFKQNVVGSSPAKSVMQIKREKSYLSYLGKIKHRFCQNQEKYTILKEFDLLKYIKDSNLTYQEFQDLLLQDKTCLKVLKEYLPWIFNRDPAIKKLSKTLGKNLTDILYDIVKIERPTHQENQISLYYRLVVPKV